MREPSRNDEDTHFAGVSRARRGTRTGDPFITRSALTARFGSEEPNGGAGCGGVGSDLPSRGHVSGHVRAVHVTRGSPGPRLDAVALNGIGCEVEDLPHDAAVWICGARERVDLALDDPFNCADELVARRRLECRP